MNETEALKQLKWLRNKSQLKTDKDFTRPLDIAISALEKQSASPIITEQGICEHCPNCESGEWLRNEDGNGNEYCGQCGIKLDWGDGE